MKIPLFIRRLKRLVKTGTLKSQELVDYRRFIGHQEFGYNQPLFNLAIDFELAWSRARRGDKAISDKESLERGRKASEAIPVILDLAEQYSIPITFAVVGHLVLTDCKEHKNPPPFRPYWLSEDWFGIDSRIKSSDKGFYSAPEVVREIAQRKIKHEIASHGFTHVNLADDATTNEVARYEIEESAKALSKIKPNLKTFIFPKNKPAFHRYLLDFDFKIYRSDKNAKIQKDQFGLWQFPLGLWISPTAQSPGEIIGLLNLAVKCKSLINLWFHGYEFNNLEKVKSFLEPIFRAANERRRAGLQIKTMRDIIYDYERR